MAAHIPTLPVFAAAAAQTALSGAGGPDTGKAVPIGVFAALFQTLSDRQAGAGAGINVATTLFAAGDAATKAVMPDSEAAEVSDELAALLPFLEALGITQPPSVPVQIDREAPHTAPETVDIPQGVAAALLVNVPATTVPATSAGEPAAKAAPHAHADTDKKAILPAAVSTAPGNAQSTAFAAPTKDGDTAVAAPAVAAPADVAPAALAEKTTAPAVAKAGDAAEAKELSRGREFSAQLVAAIAAGKEGERSPGSVAAAVQQVIAEASPRHTEKGESASDEVAAEMPPAQAIAGTSLRNGHTATAKGESVRFAEPVGSAGWGEEIGNRLVWMANRMEGKAELVLTPPQMGRIEVSLSVSGEQATASFVSANAAVREALEAALPRLREILADAGIQLGQAQVGTENAGQSAQQEKNGGNFGFNAAARVDNAKLPVQPGDIRAAADLKKGHGLVDVFA